MEMTRERFDALVGELEEKASTNFPAYKRRVLWLALLGYGYIFAVVAVVLLIIAMLIALMFTGKAVIFKISLKLMLPLVLLVGVVLRALWVRVEPPPGIEIRREQAPRLFKMIDEVRRAVAGPVVHRVQVDDEFNASISQVPRLGVLGWQRNYLTVGLPLLEALSIDEFRAVLAHEMGHLSGAHGRFGAWIYRIRATWMQLLAAFEEKKRTGEFVFKRFFEWYAPYFHAYSFVLARRHEYEADRTAADLVGTGRMAMTLAKVDVYGSLLAEKFWPSLLDRARAQAHPPDAFLEMQNALRSRIAPDLAGRWLDRALSALTGTVDTHPSLADRLSALGEEARLPEPEDVTAAEDLFGDELPRLVERFNASWKENVASSWRERYESMQQKERRLAELDEKAATERLNEEEEWDRASLTEELRGMEQALSLYRAIHEASPVDAIANFHFGRALLETGDESGIGMIERSMGLDHRGIVAGCSLIHDFLLAQGRGEEAEKYYERGRAQADMLDKAQAERAELRFSDSYAEHGLAAEEMAKIVDQLREYEDVAEAYLIRKVVKYFPESPLYVCGIEPKKKKKRELSDEARAALKDLLASNLAFPGEAFVVILSSTNQKMRTIMRGIEGSLIYRAE